MARSTTITVRISEKFSALIRDLVRVILDANARTDVVVSENRRLRDLISERVDAQAERDRVYRDADATGQTLRAAVERLRAADAALRAEAER